MDDRLLDAAIAVLDEHGFAGLTLERVAERAGRSRVTLWRQGVTQEALLDGLRDAMWPTLADSGSGADRLRVALDALCDIADRHLQLLTVSDDAFHLASQRVRDITGQAFSFLDPFSTALRAGAADGSLKLPDGAVADLADALFNTVCWGYVHLRRRHGWPDARARRPVLDIALAGLGA